MSGMGKGKKAGEETKLVGDPDAVRQGYLKRWKKKKARLFVLWQKSEKGEARIEYYEDKNKLDKPHKVFYLKDIFRVSVKPPTKEEFPFSLHMNDEIFQVSCSSEEEVQQWVMDIITTRPRGADRDEVEPLGHVMMWRVTVLHKGISNIFKFQRNTFIFVLDNYSFGLINPDDHSDCWHWQMKNIRNCGHEGNCFVFECGRSSFCGEGHLCLQMYSSKLAVEAHHTVLDQMRKCVPDPTIEVALANRLLEQKQRLEPRGRRPRGMSEPMQPIRTFSPPPATSRSHSVGKIQSNSIKITHSPKHANRPHPTPTDDEVYMEMHSVPTIREQTTQLPKSLTRHASVPEAHSSSLEQLVSPSSRSQCSSGSQLRHIHDPHPTQVQSSASQSEPSGYDAQHQSLHQPKRQNVFLQRQQSNELCIIEDEEPQYFCNLSPRPNSPSCSPSPASLSVSPQPASLHVNSQDSSSPQQVVSAREIIRRRRIARHVYEQVDEIADSGVFGISSDSQSRSHSVDEPYQEMNLQASRSYEPMSFEGELSPPSETNTQRSQPIPVKASGHSHNPQSDYEVMSPQGRQTDNPSLYEDMNLVTISSRPHAPYINHQLYQNHQLNQHRQPQWCAGGSVNDRINYESPCMSRSASSSPPKVC